MSAGLGHNNGPTMEAGESWRRHCWKASRKALLPKLPINTLRRRIARAKELGLDYSTYATIRETGGRDIIAILFSTNALRLMQSGAQLPKDRVAKLSGLIDVHRNALTQPPVEALRLMQSEMPIDSAARAPAPHALWPEQQDRISAAVRQAGANAPSVILVGAAPWERDWCAAGRFAGYVAADRYFT